MMPPDWFQTKWGINKPNLTDELYLRILELEKQVKNLKEENIEKNNLIYEVMNSIEAVDTRIDILMENSVDV